MYFYDFTYILVLIGALLCMWASFNVKSTFNKYSKIANSHGYTGREVAEKILEISGIYDVRVQHISGSLSDHYSPNENVLRLSDSVYDSRSVAAIGVAAHECGHAVQHHVGYFPVHLRTLAVPLANFGSKLSWPLIVLGLFLGFTGLAQFGVALFVLVVFFQIITLPVEFDASSRALKILDANNILTGDELKAAKKVLTAAAMTYVAAVISSLLQLLRLVLLTKRSRRD